MVNNEVGGVDVRRWGEVWRGEVICMVRCNGPICFMMGWERVRVGEGGRGPEESAYVCECEVNGCVICGDGDESIGRTVWR